MGDNRQCILVWLCAAACALVIGCGKPQAAAPGPLYCYVGGTMRPVMEALASRYEQQIGQKIELDYGDSGSNIIKVETTSRGDLYVAHDPFHGSLVRKALTREGWCVATLTPVIVVPKGNPGNIEGLKDLARPGLRVILTDREYSTLGHVCGVMLKKAGIEDEIEKRVVTRPRMGGEAANAIIVGHADAAIVWNAVAYLRREKLDTIPIEPAYRPVPNVDAVTTATFGLIDMGTVRVTIDVLKCSKQPEAARAFAEFVASSAEQKAWQDLGFGLPRGGPAKLEAAQMPAGSLLLYAGAGLRPAVEEIAKAFTAQTGIVVNCDWAGSGMLISRLRLSQQGDLFLPGDLWYVELAEKEALVESKATACYLVPVILVRKGNPLGIRGLADLARPGLRLGLGKPEACQVGRTSDEILKQSRIDPAAIEKNLVFSATTVNELGLQVQTGHLDAAIVWDAIAAYYAKDTEAVAIPPEQNKASEVTIAVLKCSRQAAVAKSFVDFLCGEQAKAIFRKHQYRTEPPR